MSGSPSAKSLTKLNKGFNSLPPLSFPGVFKIISQDDKHIDLCCVNRKVMQQWFAASIIYYSLLLLLDPRLLGLLEWFHRVTIFFDTAYLLGALLPLGAFFYYRLNGEASLKKSESGGEMTYSYTEFLKQKTSVVPFSMIDAVAYFEHGESSGYLYLICAQGGPVFLVSPPPAQRKPAQAQEFSLVLADWIGCGWNHIGPDGTMVSQLPRRN